MKFTVSLLVLGLLLTGRLAVAQRLTLSGQVVEAASGEPVPFASIFVPRTSTGITADVEGKFKLTVAGAPDSLAASSLGFLTLRKKLTDAPQQTILFRLRKGGGVALGEVVVSSRQPENPAFRILREVQKHKPENERTALHSAEFSSYNRIEVSLTDLPKAMANRKVVKDIRALAVRQGAAAAADPDAPLPLFASEVGSQVYVKYGPPQHRREDIQHKQMRGAGPREGSVLSQMLGSNFQNFDFYPNWQNILGKDFISPISAGGRLTYDYDLQDSLLVGQDMCYKIRVTPRRSHDLAFRGTIWITKEGYALRRLDVIASEHANLNFVTDLRIFQELTPPAQGPGLAARTRLVVAIQPGEKQAALRVRFTTMNSDFRRNVEHEGSFYNQPIVSTVMEPGTDNETSGLVSGLRQKGETEGYFDKNRPDTLSLSERQTFAVLDSARELPSVRSTLDWIDLFINGYKRVGGENSKVELGPIINTFAYNNFEGARFRLGFRTTPAFSRNVVLQPYVAYGTKDGRFKYGLRASYIAERRHWTVFGGEYRHDVEQYALLDNDFLPDNNLFVAASRWGRFKEGLPLMRDLSLLSVQRDLFHGFTQTVILRYQNSVPQFQVRTQPRPGGNDPTMLTPEKLHQTEVVLESRYAPDENLVQAENRRRAIGLKRWPVFTFRYTFGTIDWFRGNNTYSKYNLLMTHSLSAGHFGRLNYRVEGSYIPSEVSYLILKTPLGNQTPFYNVNSFNLLNYREFVTDRSVSLRLDHHFEGVIMNAIPGIRSFNWRLVATANFLYGGLTDANKLSPIDGRGNQFLLPSLGRTPYIEAGYGIENIFKFIRVDFIHRVTYRDALPTTRGGPTPPNFAVKVGAQFRL